MRHNADTDGWPRFTISTCVRATGPSAAKPQPKPASPPIVPLAGGARRASSNGAVSLRVGGLSPPFEKKASVGVGPRQLILGIAKIWRLEWISPRVEWDPCLTTLRHSALFGPAFLSLWRRPSYLAHRRRSQSCFSDRRIRSFLLGSSIWGPVSDWRSARQAVRRLA